ncbi:hypothetical protein BDY17DRAFT_304411 [Neohortaea acidophila]|uniref:GATA-type domain-containing protein n=1 Tax=Neohortaea acidophila TaxID=245834 RepID=A0A6A6PIC1_9PEZI|nr:uncharacterized protein BDY17DRAFT_304411 [Neohortaea acidophila]KAF2479675.1 hypothetical protein BDY17DRAFT_304411 [Neohortaea acidophila]
MSELILLIPLLIPLLLATAIHPSHCSLSHFRRPNSIPNARNTIMTAASSRIAKAPRARGRPPSTNVPCADCVLRASQKQNASSEIELCAHCTAALHRHRKSQSDLPTTTPVTRRRCQKTDENASRSCKAGKLPAVHGREWQQDQQFQSLVSAPLLDCDCVWQQSRSHARDVGIERPQEYGVSWTRQQQQQQHQPVDATYSYLPYEQHRSTPPAPSNPMFTRMQRPPYPIENMSSHKLHAPYYNDAPTPNIRRPSTRPELFYDGDGMPMPNCYDHEAFWQEFGVAGV